MDVKASEGVGIQTTDRTVYLSYRGGGVLSKVDGAIYTPCACEDSDGLEGGLELLRRFIQLDTYERGERKNGGAP